MRARVCRVRRLPVCLFVVRSDNRIGPDGAARIAAALATNTTLTTVDLGGKRCDCACVVVRAPYPLRCAAVRRVRLGVVVCLLWVGFELWVCWVVGT